MIKKNTIYTLLAVCRSVGSVPHLLAHPHPSVVGTEDSYTFTTPTSVLGGTLKTCTALFGKASIVKLNKGALATKAFEFQEHGYHIEVQFHHGGW